MNREELAWAAGFFDGEGTTAVKRPLRSRGNESGHRVYKQDRAAYPLMTAMQVDRHSLVRLKAAVRGLGHISGPYRVRSERHQPISRWETTSFEHFQAVLAMLWQFLGPVKRAQAVRAIEAHREWRARMLAGRNFCLMGHKIEGENLRIEGHRNRCRECGNTKAREYATRRRAARRIPAHG